MAIDTQRIKEKLADWAYDAKEALLDFADDFRRQTPFFKAKVGVIGGFVLLVLATFIIAPAPGEANPCEAKVLATDLGWKTVIEVFNQSGSDFDAFLVAVEGDDVDLEGGTPRAGSWRIKPRRLGEGRSYIVEAKHLRDDNGRRPGINFKPRVVEVRCEAGVYRTQVTLRALR